MPFIKLRKANEAGQQVGTFLVNTDQIVVIGSGQNTTELQMADGKTRWVLESVDEMASLIKAST